jgi:hypothetical protein
MHLGRNQLFYGDNLDVLRRTSDLLRVLAKRWCWLSMASDIGWRLWAHSQ